MAFFLHPLFGACGGSYEFPYLGPAVGLGLNNFFVGCNGLIKMSCSLQAAGIPQACITRCAQLAGFQIPTGSGLGLVHPPVALGNEQGQPGLFSRVVRFFEIFLQQFTGQTVLFQLISKPPVTDLGTALAGRKEHKK